MKRPEQIRPGLEDRKRLVFPLAFWYDGGGRKNTMAAPPNPSRGRSEPDELARKHKLPTRDRLLGALQSGPRLSDEDAREINKLIQEAREASIGDALSA